MGAFGIGTNMDLTEAGVINGYQFEIACSCWFTSDHKSRPVLIKFEGEDGVIYTVKDIEIITTDFKNYSGIPSTEFKCRAIIGGFMHEFKLIFFPTESRWVMVI